MLIDRLELQQKELDKAIETQKREIRKLQSFKQELEKHLQFREAIKDKAKEQLSTKELKKAPPATKELVLRKVGHTIAYQTKEVKAQLKKISKVKKEIQSKVNEVAHIKKKKEKIGELIFKKKSEKAAKQEELELSEITTQAMLRKRFENQNKVKIEENSNPFINEAQEREDTDIRQEDFQLSSDTQPLISTEATTETISSKLLDNNNASTSISLNINANSKDDNRGGNNNQSHHRLLEVAQSYGIKIGEYGSNATREDTYSLAHQIRELALEVTSEKSAIDLVWEGVDGNEYGIKIIMPAKKELLVTIVAEKDAKFGKEEQQQLKNQLEMSGFTVRNIQVLKKY